MPRRLVFSAATICIVAFAVACGDANRSVLPTGPTVPGAASQSNVPGTCTTLSNLTSLARTVFGAGSPNVNSVLGKLDNLDKRLKRGDVAGAQAEATTLVTFIQKKVAAGGLPGTRAQVQALISGVLCYAGLLPNTTLIYPSDQPQVITEPSGAAGVSLQGNTVSEPTLLTIQLLDPAGPSPLITKLDKYPAYVQLISSSPLTKPAVVGVCPSASVPAEVLGRLRLGHQATAGFEITPAADAGFLNCSGVAASRMPAWLRNLASLVLPRPLYAATMFAGGVGGLASEFSPFGPVDPDLGFVGGVGGLASEFSISFGAPTVAGAAKSTPSNTLPSMSVTPGSILSALSAPCASVEAIVGTGLAPECRPVVTITTHNGTVLQNVPVAWTVTFGGGVIAPQALATTTCGAPYSSAAATVTDANGKASVCWTLGAAAGTNTVIGRPSAGGDAPAGVHFTPPAVNFTATGTLVTPTASASGATAVYDALPHAGSGTCSNGLTPALSYSGGTVPVNVGSYTLTVTCSGANYVTVSSSAAITISAYTPVVAVTCPASVVYTSAAQTPCSATVTAPGLSGPLTPAYASNTNVGTATATASTAAGGNYGAGSAASSFSITQAAATATAGSGSMIIDGSVPALPCTVTGLFSGDAGAVTCTTSVPATLVPGTNATAAVPSPASPQNYAMRLVNGALAVRYQVSCFAPPVYSSLPPLTLSREKGSTVTIACTLQTARGTAVTGATGDLNVQDVGIDGLAAGVLVFSRSNAFVEASGVYSFGLATSPIAFISGHYYQVTATWNDGSTAVGYIYLR